MIWPAVAMLLAATASVAASLFMRFLVRAVVSSRARRRRATDAPVVAEVLARSLRTGLGMPDALAEAAENPAVGSFQAELAVVVADWRAGAALGEALDAWRSRSGGPEVALLVAAIRLGQVAGGDRARVLDAVSSTLDDRLALAGDLGAAGAQARASALVLAAAPAVLALLFILIDPSVFAETLASDAGRAALALGAALGAVGWWWMARLVRRVSPNRVHR